MEDNLNNNLTDDELEVREWLESLEYVLQEGGPEKVKRLLHDLDTYAHQSGVDLPFTANTPYINTIPYSKEAKFPGGREIERRIKSIIRWNAMAMVVRANKEENGIGGHISTYASAATLYEVGFNHFFRGKDENSKAILSFSKVMRPPVYIAEHFWKGALAKSN